MVGVSNGAKALSYLHRRIPPLLELDKQLPPALAGAYNFATGVNDRGEIAFMGDRSAGASGYAALRYIVPPNLIPLPPIPKPPGPANYFTRKINLHGDIVGCATVSPTQSLPFVSTAVPPATSILGVVNPPGNGSAQQALDINDNGDVVGSFAVPTGGTHAFIYHKGGHLADLNAGLHGPVVMEMAFGISNAGQIVGQGAVGGATQAFSFAHGVVRNLGALPGGGGSSAQGINDGGTLIVGYAVDAQNFQRACLFDVAGPVDLNSLVAPGWFLLIAVAVNDAGLIAATGWRGTEDHPTEINPASPKEGIQHALLLNP